MRKSIFNPEHKAEILQRLEKLNHDTQPKWGIMKPNQMLRHLQEAHKINLGELKIADKSNLFTRTIIRGFVLGAKVPSIEQIRKRPIVTFDEINVIERNIHSDEFEKEKENFKKDLERVLNAEYFAPRSPSLGKMSKENWGELTYSHAHYHFSQFGV